MFVRMLFRPMVPVLLLVTLPSPELEAPIVSAFFFGSVIFCTAALTATRALVVGPFFFLLTLATEGFLFLFLPRFPELVVARDSVSFSRSVVFGTVSCGSETLAGSRFSEGIAFSDVVSSFVESSTGPL